MPAPAADPMSRLIGIDLGDKRIGVATGDTASGIVRPLTTLGRRSAREDAAAIARICSEHQADAVVVGLPLNMDGSDGEQSARTRDWVEAVEIGVDVPMILGDERLTSEAAEARMGRMPRGRSGAPPSPSARRAWRARIDREAAAAIVQREIDARARTIEVTP